MGTRRRFLKRMLFYATTVGLGVRPWMDVVLAAAAKTGRRILPRGTPMSGLLNERPDALDTRNLEPIPLNQFGTMGLSDHQTDIARWRLKVVGRVDRPLELSYMELLRLPAIERDVLLICPGVFANFGRWKGVAFATLFKAARAAEGVTHVTVRGPEGPYEMVQRFPVTDAASNAVFLAYQVNGQDLPQKHGYPLRAVAEGYYGFDWIKFVHEVDVNII